MEEESQLAEDGGQESDEESDLCGEDGGKQERETESQVKEYWRLHHDEQLKKMMVGEHKRPDKLERRLIGLIERNELPFRYVGDWEFMVAGKCPDFLSTDGRKLLIELF